MVPVVAHIVQEPEKRFDDITRLCCMIFKVRKCPPVPPVPPMPAGCARTCVLLVPVPVGQHRPA